MIVQRGFEGLIEQMGDGEVLGEVYYARFRLLLLFLGTVENSR
jgi:hypothetical protein